MNGRNRLTNGYASFRFRFATLVGAFHVIFSIYIQYVTATRTEVSDPVPLFGNADYTENEGVTEGNFLQKLVASGRATVSRFHVDSKQ